MRWIIFLMLLPLAGCLGDGETQSQTEALPEVEPFAFKEPVLMVCPSTPLDPVHPQADCGRFMEPVLEVAGDGTIWYSATCCVGRAPPIWMSTDGGETFEAIPFGDGTGILRDGTGIEGDFAIDDAGNVYFFDILLATAYLTKFDGDGNHIHTKPDPFEPLVDRPWIRAGVEDEVFIFYNTGGSTNFLRSTTGGLTWDYAGMTSFPCPLMTFGQGAQRDHMFVTGCTGNPSIWETKDGGETWGPRTSLPRPDYAGARNTEYYMPVAGDADGNIYVTSVWEYENNGTQQGIFVNVVHANGTLGPAVDVSGPGWHEKPWPAAGDAGNVALAWYGSNGTKDVPNDNTWFLHTAYNLNATTNGTWVHAIADPEPVLEGDFGRRLGDFLEARMGPDGDFHIAYARNINSPENLYLRSSAPHFGVGVPYNG